METRSNILMVTIVGGLLIAGLLVFIVYIGGPGSYGARYEIRFEKSVAGLAKGSPVLQQGVTVGRVETIALDPGDPGVTRVKVAIEEELPLRRGVRADISRAFMDGTASVVLLPSSDGPLINPTGKNIGRIASVGGERRPDPATAAAGMTASLDGIAQRLDADGRKRIGDQLATAAGRTANWDARVTRLLDGLSAHPADGAARSIAGAGQMADRLNRSVLDAEQGIATVRSEVRDFGNGADDFARAVDEARPAVRSVSEDLRRARRPVGDAADAVERARDKVEGLEKR